MGIEGVGQSTWSQVKQSGILHSTWDPAYLSTECCSLKPGKLFVAFYTDCFRQDIMRPNYTKQVLEGRKGFDTEHNRHLDDIGDYSSMSDAMG